MACNNGHDTCIGEVCTVTAGPKRTLIGQSRERQTLMDSLITALSEGGGHKVKLGPCNALYGYWHSEKAIDAVRKCRIILGNETMRWEFSIKLLLQNNQDFWVKVNIKRRKGV